MEEDFEMLCVRAATLDELLSEVYEARPGEKKDADLAATRLAAWCKAASAGDWNAFQQRLERDGLTLVFVLERLATVRRRASAEVPEWLADARWIYAALHVVASRDLTVRPTEAFEELLSPVVAASDLRLRSSIGPSAENLAAEAFEQLGKQLLKKLSELTAGALYDGFVIFRREVDEERLEAKSQVPCDTYHDYLDEMRGDGWQTLLRRKPILLRLMAELVRQWLSSCVKLIVRLNEDLTDLQREGLVGAYCGQVRGIQTGLSDVHNGGFSVSLLVFESGERLIYKPKDMRIDAAWYRLVRQLNVSKAPYDLRAARVLACEGYGWSEFIRHSGCDDKTAFRRYFERSGAWLALLHVFSATDIHQENIIAEGDYPVPIDLEMILQGSPVCREAAPEDAAYAAASELIDGAVGAVGLLPIKVHGERGVESAGGLSDASELAWSEGWADLNTAMMRPIRVRRSVLSSNLPHVDGLYASFSNHFQDVISGYSTYSRFIIENKHLIDNALLAGFRGLKVRRVFRPTKFYSLLLKRVFDHKSMIDGAIWSAQIDFIARLADWDDDADGRWQLLRAERVALSKLNIPYFETCSAGGLTQDGFGTAAVRESHSGIERARERLRNLDERVIAHQVEFILFYAASVVPAKFLVQKRPSESPTAKSNSADFAHVADRLAEKLAARSIMQGESAAWIGLGWAEGREVCQFMPLPDDLYSGNLGICVFLAAYARVTGRREFGQLANMGVASLRKTLRSKNAARYARLMGLGGGTGLGSIIYGLSLMSEFLDSRALLVSAKEAARLISSELVAADRQLDVVGGAAGAVLGLLRLYRLTGDNEVLESAECCGEHILLNSQYIYNDMRIRELQKSALTGMAHGAAGIFLALSALSQETARKDFAQMAVLYSTYETEAYSEALGDWPDPREEKQENRPCQWCYGAPGIALSRLASLRLGFVKSASPEIDRALQISKSRWPLELDTLCCGSLGTIELFREAGKLLRQPMLEGVASQKLSELVGRATAGFSLGAGGEALNLGLFRGLAGVGYTCLREVEPTLPNILVWE